jgi:hypothetical protein
MSTIPSLALLPSGYKASKVYSVLPTDGTGDFDFTRSGNATRVNSEGLIELVSTNVPRLNYPLIDGVVSGCPSLLLEPQRTNLIQYSEDFSQGWTASNIVIGSASSISPNGSLSAFNIKSNIISGGKYIYDDNSVSVSTTYTLSGFFKKKTHNFASLLINQRTSASVYIGQLAVNIDLVNGVIDTENFATAPTLINSKIENYGNGWYRVVLTATTSSTATIIRSCVGLAGSTSSFEYFGTVSDEVYAFGIQLEQGSYPTSYIPNYGTALGATRSAETCNNAGDVNTFNDSEGVLMIETKGENDGTFNYISISDGGTQNYAGILYTDNDNQITYRYYVGGSGVQIAITNIIVTNFNKIAIKYKANDFAIWINGIERGTASSGSLNPSGTFNELSFARGGSNNTPFYGNTKQIQYFDTALTDSDLETLTSWDSFSDMATSQLYTIE